MFDFKTMFKQFGGYAEAYNFKLDWDALHRMELYLASFGYDEPDDECDGFDEWYTDDFLADPDDDWSEEDEDEEG